MICLLSSFNCEISSFIQFKKINISVVNKDKKRCLEHFLAVSQREFLSLAKKINRLMLLTSSMWNAYLTEALSLSCLYSRWHLKKLLYAYDFNLAKGLCVLKAEEFSD